MVERLDRSGRLRSWWRVACLMGLVVTFLLPVLGTGYWAEDVHHSALIPGRMILSEGTLLDEVVGHVKHTIIMGRFFPITPALISLVHATIQDVFAYKAFLVAMTALDVLAFYALVRKLGGRAGFAGFAACVTLGLFQFRVNVDPFLAYYGQMQLVVAALFVSLIALLNALEGRGTGWFLIAVGCFAICALTYEASYPLVLLHLGLIWRGSTDMAGSHATVLPFVVVVGLCAAATVLVRRLYPAEIYWHRTDFDPGAMLLALAHQTSAALPLSYLLADPLDLFPGLTDVRSMLGWVVQGRTIAVAAVALALSYACIRRGDRPGAPTAIDRAGIAAIGLMLAVLPAVMLTISPYHRSWLSFGVGWVPVMIQCYGVGMLLTAGLWGAVGAARSGRTGSWRPALLASGLVAVLVGITDRANREAALSFNSPPGTERHREFAARHGASWHYHRLNLEAALDRGLMDEVPDRAVVRMASEYPYWYDATYSKFFFAKHTGKDFTTVPPSAIESTPPAPSPSYRIKDAVLGRRIGFVVLWRDRAGEEDDRSTVRIFVRHPRGAAFRLVGDPLGSGGAAIRRDRDELTLIRSGRDWALYSVEVPIEGATAHAWRVEFAAIASDRLSGPR